MSGNNLRTQFAEHGYARLDGAFVANAGELARSVLAELARDPSGKLSALRRKGVFDRVATPAVRAAISVLLGQETWPEPFSWGDPLVTRPSPGGWAVPDRGWHLDFPARGALLLKWLGYLAPVGPGGGGTVVLAGSHHLVGRWLERADPADPGRSPVVRDAVFGAHPGLLTERGTIVDGIAVRVVELTGEPGDLVFLHPHLFHAPAPNRAAVPRLMITGGLAQVQVT